MPSLEAFKELVANAYRYLYDMVRLRTDPLADYLIHDPTLKPTERAWQLHDTLTRAIEDLNPGVNLPINSKAWRRYRLMWLRYVEAMDPQAVADQLAISKRQFYREHNEALDTVAETLFASVEEKIAGKFPPPSPQPSEAEYLSLLRLEASRVNQRQRYVDLNNVVGEALAILQEMFSQRQVQVHNALAANLPTVAIDRGLLRQLLLGMLSLAVRQANAASIRLTAQLDENCVVIAVDAQPAEADKADLANDLQQQVDALEELAQITNVLLHRPVSAQGRLSFQVELPIGMQHTILVVDDNADMLSLYRRYLVPHNFHVVTESSARKVGALVRRLQPSALVLDLMMPDQDGWDVIQSLTNAPDTQHVPIVVCSVLKQRELALSLGASAFLEKPITEDQLLIALGALVDRE